MIHRIRSGISRYVDVFGADARHYQLLFLLIFLLTGLFRLNWSLPSWQIPLTFLTALITQLAGVFILRLPWHSLKSAVISSFSLSLLFRTDQYWAVILAAVLTIASKFIFRIKGKHFYNPANFGICATILISGRAWISPGQWGSEGLWLFLVGVLGVLVVTRARRMELALSFALAYGGCFAIRMLLWQNWPSDALSHLFTNGSLLLFTFFMITDPASTPAHKTIRIIWAALTGVLAFYMQAYLWINASPLWALFILSPLTPVMDHFFKGEKWNWQAIQVKARPVIQTV